MRRGSAIVLALAALSTAGCVDHWTRARRDPGAVLWVSSQSAELDRDELVRLQAAGVGELFLRAAVVEWAGKRPSLAAAPPLQVPRRTLVTLVVEGEWPGAELETEEVALRLADELRALKIEAESHGMLPRGFHLHLAAGGRLGSYAETLGALRRELGKDLFLSVTVDPEWLDDEELPAVLSAVHFSVCFLYGRRLGAPDADRYWDLDAIEETARRLDALGTDFLVGVLTDGSLARLDGGGDVVATAAQADLRGLLDADALEPKAAFLFEGFHRQVLEFEARRPVRVGEWTLRRKERLRLTRTTAYHLAELHQRLAALDLAGYLGEAYDGSPGSDEGLALGLEPLLVSREVESPSPDLILGVDLLGQRRDRWVVRARLRNRGPLGTSLALVEANYLELYARDSTVERVELGQFRRMELGRGRQSYGSRRGVRNADSLRLYYPLVDGGWGVVSGPISLTTTQPELELELRASFLLPGGRTYETTRLWRPGTEEEEDGGEEEGEADTEAR